MRDKQRRISWFQKHIANRTIGTLAGYLPTQAVLVTTGRKSGLPRRTPVGGKIIDGAFWLVAEYGTNAQWVRNLRADPAVRLKTLGRWYSGTATLLPDDDVAARLRTLPKVNSTMVKLISTTPVTIRIDLD